MKIALAQILAFQGSIEKNIELHKQCIHHALAEGAAAIFFPELSLSGYEPTLADGLKMTVHDGRLLDFQEISDQSKLVIGMGMPLKKNGGVQIAMAIIQPKKKLFTYAKQWLHGDEKPFFIPGNRYGHVEIGHVHLSLAICYESLHKAHLEQAMLHKPDIYLASTAKSEKGVEKAFRRYREISKKNGLHVLFCNSIGPCDNFLGAGQSAAWNAEGELLEKLPSDSQGILIFDSKKHTAKITLI